MTPPLLISGVCSLAVVVLCISPALAGAELTLPPGSTVLEATDKAGAAENRAGAHPDRFSQSFEVLDTGGPPETLRELVIDLPAGFGGDVRAVPFCSPATAHLTLGGSCPDASQIGTLTSAGGEVSPVYNVEPGPNQLAEFAVVGTAPLIFSAELRPADRGLSLRASGIPAALGTGIAGKIELWGIPADHQVGTSIPRRALLTTPSRCGSPLTGTIEIRTWERPEHRVSETGSTGLPLVGCEELPFDPRVDFSLGNPRADAPSGLGVELAIPQNDDPDGRAAAQVEDVSIAMPEGMTLSPGGAAGLAVCGDAQLALGSATDAACPPGSQVGTVELRATGLSEKPIEGAVYLGQEHPGDRFRLFAVASARGNQVKLVGSLRADPKTGQLTTELHDLPQIPLDSIGLRFDGGPRALLATPLACGPAQGGAAFTTYSGTPPLARPFSVGVAGAGASSCAGPPPFAPTFSAGGTSVAAGRATSFRAVLGREDGEQLPDRMEIAFPPGLSARLGTIGACAAAAAASGACPAASRIGRALVELGPGTDPAQLEGDIYLTGPYRRSPLGLALVFAAKLGPLDLGTLVVRGAMRLDPRSGQLRVAIDALPRLLEGFSVRFQTIAMEIDRPGFLRNPTSCAPSSVTATVRAASGQSADIASPFRAQGCVGLPFRPDFAMALSGRSQLREGGKPGLRIAIGMRSRDANLRAADISLPGSLQLDSSGLREICARGEAVNGNCPKASRVGSASVRTPLLKEPLRGSIYIAQPRGGGQPDLWTHLEGGGLSLDMKSSAAKRDGQLHTRLSDLPDIPIAQLTMRFGGGERGLFSLDRDLCRAGKPRQLQSRAASEGQNGARALRQVPVIARPGCEVTR